MNESSSGLPADFVKETLSNVNAKHLARYPEYEHLERSIAKHDAIGPEQICLSNGSDTAIKFIFEAFISAGDNEQID